MAATDPAGTGHWGPAPRASGGMWGQPVGTPRLGALHPSSVPGRGRPTGGGELRGSGRDARCGGLSTLSPFTEVFDPRTPEVGAGGGDARDTTHLDLRPLGHGLQPGASGGSRCDHGGRGRCTNRVPLSMSLQYLRFCTQPFCRSGGARKGRTSAYAPGAAPALAGAAPPQPLPFCGSISRHSN